MEVNNKLPIGRPPGAINKKTKHFQEVLAERGFDVAEALLDLFDEANKQYKKCDAFDPLAVNQALKLLVEITKEIASYSLPKLKSIEIVKTNPLEGMTPQERLEILKEAIKVLELETKDVTP